MGASTSYATIGMGFWLPCGRANFFDPDDDRSLINTSRLADLRLRTGESLESSVCRRLVTVLRKKGYSHALWLSPKFHQGYTNAFDPEAVVLICENPIGWPQDLGIKGLILMVNEEGFYLWLVIYEDISMRVGEDEAQKYGKRVQNALSSYIAQMGGGDYFSHFSGKDANEQNNPNRLHHIAKYEREAPLTRYRDEHMGILNFFQLNLILEGLYNSNFDPEVFFSQDNQVHSVEEVKKKYSLGEFFATIIVSVPLQEDRESEDRELWFVENVEKLFHFQNMKIENDPFARQLFDGCLTDVTRKYILQQFLRNTSIGMLRTLKWYIERCRRTLLSEMIGITHRRQPLLQLESPDDSMDQISKANEAQIRGYVMLIAAKLPLIANIKRYMIGVMEGISKEDVRNSLQSWFSSWSTMIQAIDDNIKGLEHAIEQARMDRLLYEEEQIRAEEETMAEIERIRQRTSANLTEADNAVIGLVANGIALLATTIAALGVLIAFATASSPLTIATLGKDITQFLQSLPLLSNFSQFLRSIPPVLAILVGIAIIVLFYFSIAVIFHALMGRVKRWYNDFKRKVIKIGDRTQYEMDMRLDAHINSEEQILKLIDAEFGMVQNTWWNQFKHRKLRQRLITRFAKPERNSYRVERMSEDEALHKIHIETDILWPSRWLWWSPIKSYWKMHCFLTYELLFHRPSEAPSYLLRELRFVAEANRILSSQQLEELKLIIINEFVNYWLDKNYQLSIDPSEEPLLVLSPVGPKSTCATGTQIRSNHLKWLWR